MTNAFVMSQVTLSLGGFLLLAWNFHKLRQDNYRSDIRRIRDGIFDSMIEGNYSFSTREYIETRQTLNGMLLMSGSMSNVKFLLIGFIYSWFRESEQEPKASQISPELSRILQVASASASRRMLTFFFLEGMTGLICSGVFYILSLLELVKTLKRWTTIASHRMMRNFFYAGDPNVRHSFRLTS